MKKFYLFAAAAAAILAVSCNKEQPSIEAPVVPEIQDGRSLVSLLVAPGSTNIETRAAGDAVEDTQAERTINNIDVFYIDHATKALDSYASEFTQTATAENGATTVAPVKVTDKPMDIWVVANAPAELKNSVTNEATLLEAISQFTQNTTTNFVMVGNKLNVDLPAATTTEENGLQLVDRSGQKVKVVSGIVLERIVNKLTIGKITKDFASPALQASDVKLMGMYIVNANKQVVYTAKLAGEKIDAIPAAADASYWNPSHKFEQNDLITRTYTEAKSILATTGTELNEAFYFYPNPAVEATDITLEDYVTKLVLKVQIGGHLYWYPVGITQQRNNARNLVYEIENITLKGLGNNADPYDPTDPGYDPDDPVKPKDDPNKYLNKANVEVQLTVKDWVSADVTGSYNGWME